MYISTCKLVIIRPHPLTQPPIIPWKRVYLDNELSVFPQDKHNIV